MPTPKATRAALATPATKKVHPPEQTASYYKKVVKERTVELKSAQMLLSTAIFVA